MIQVDVLYVLCSKFAIENVVPALVRKIATASNADLAYERNNDGDCIGEKYLVTTSKIKV